MDPRDFEKDEQDKRNAFLFFIRRRKSEPDIQNMCTRQKWEEISNFIQTEWEDMPKEGKKNDREKVCAKIEEIQEDDGARESFTAEMRGAITFSEKLVVPSEMRMKVSGIRNKYWEDILFCKLWSHPEGQDNKAVVIYMNHYVSHDLLHIPCEIGLVSFTIKSDMVSQYWTLMDPGEPPIGEGGQFSQSVAKYGVSRPPFPHSHCRDYRRIVGQIESFLKQHILPETNQPVVVCFKDSMNQVQKGMEWLYKKADYEIANKDEHWSNGMKTIEKLLIVLSMGGLENMAKAERKDLEDILTIIPLRVTGFWKWNSSSSGISVSGSSEVSQFSSIPLESYMKLGSVTRVASFLTDQHSIMLGAFFCERQVTDYMRNIHYAHMRSLACKFHKENEQKRENDDDG